MARGTQRGIQEEASFVSLRWIATRWSCSRQTVRRVLQSAGIKPLYLGDAQNGTLRFALEDVLDVEAQARGIDGSTKNNGLPP